MPLATIWGTLHEGIAARSRKSFLRPPATAMNDDKRSSSILSSRRRSGIMLMPAASRRVGNTIQTPHARPRRALQENLDHQDPSHPPKHILAIDIYQATLAFQNATNHEHPSTTRRNTRMNSTNAQRESDHLETCLLRAYTREVHWETSSKKDKPTSNTPSTVRLRNCTRVHILHLQSHVEKNGLQSGILSAHITIPAIVFCACVPQNYQQMLSTRSANILRPGRTQRMKALPPTPRH